MEETETADDKSDDMKNMQILASDSIEHACESLDLLLELLIRFDHPWVSKEAKAE